MAGMGLPWAGLAAGGWGSDLCPLLLALILAGISFGAAPVGAQQELECGEQIARDLAAGAVDRFTFRTADGDGVAVDFIDISVPFGVEMGYRLRAPGGELVDEACGFGFDLPLADAGEWSLEVFACEGSDAIRYTLSLFAISDNLAGAPGCGRRMSCTADHVSASFADRIDGAGMASGEVDAYRLDVGRRGRMRVGAYDLGMGLGLIELRLYAPDGTLLEDTCDGFIDRAVGPGTHTLLVNDCFGVDVGEYRVLVDTPDCPATPPNDECASASTPVSLPFVDAVNTLSAARSPDDPTPSCGFGDHGESVWYRWVAPGDGHVRVTTRGSSYDTVIAAYTGSCSALTAVPGGCNDDHAGTLQSRLELPVEQDRAYTFLITALSDRGGLLGFDLDFVDEDATPTPTAPPSGSCCAVHSGGGCDEPSCESCVCALDDFCCTEGWDDLCLETVRFDCVGSCACTSGATFTPTPTPTPVLSRTSTPPSTRTPPPSPTPTGGPGCVADCNEDGRVTIDELVRAVSVALGRITVEECPAADPNGDGAVRIDELVRGVSAALAGCSLPSPGLHSTSDPM